jgi:hypothetical protein
VKLFFQTGGNSAYACWALVLAGLALGGCHRDEIKVYRVAKNQAAPPMLSPANPPAAQPEIAAPARPRVSWRTPDGWSETPAGEMRVGSFKIKGADGQQADVSIIPLGGAAGGDVANVNRWRGQVGLEPASADEIKKLAKGVEVAGLPAELYELSGKNPGSDEPVGILAAILNLEGTAWFFKMTGDARVVAGQKAAFVEFLKTIKFEAGETAALPPSHPPIEEMRLPAGHPDISGVPAAGSPAEAGHPDWQVPPGWQPAPAGQFLVAKFIVTGDGGASAAVNVSASAGDGGGLVGNVNRWRKQLGLDEVSSDEINKSVSALDIAGAKATVAELSGTDARSGRPTTLVGVVVPQGGQTWFYKLMGDPKVVGAQKAAFTRFVQGVKY